MINGVEALKDSNELISRNKREEHIQVTCDDDGCLQALSWLYQTADSRLHGMVKKRGGKWIPASGGWVLPDSKVAQEFLDEIVEKHPEWPVIGLPGRPFLPLTGVSISRLCLTDDLDACLTPASLSSFAHVEGRVRAFRLTTGKGRKAEGEIGLLLGSKDEITLAIDAMVRQGAFCDDTLTKKYPTIKATGSKLQVKVTGWAVQVTCDLVNPLHYLVAPKQKYRWEGTFPYGTKVAILWTATINTTRKLWPAFKDKLHALGLDWEGDDPEAAPVAPAAFDVSRVAGWDRPAPNGHLLHAYQKIGVQFCANRGMRALIGDEMGVGKTVQAIAAAEACSAPRVVVICPANARYVWDREIKDWGSQGSVQHIMTQLCKLDTAARWHIITYDLITTRAETWRFRDDAEKKAFVETFPKLAKEITHEGSTSQIKLNKPLDAVPLFDAKRINAWGKIMQRLRAELLEQILSIDPLLVILDEAHRVKNKDAKRTKAIQLIASKRTQMLMLTGTPLRNNEHEAATLLSLLDDAAAATLGDKRNGYTIEDIKDYLSHFMIRRTKAEVLPELPEKTRQRIDIDSLDADQLLIYAQALDWARESYTKALNDGKSQAKARQVMHGGIEQARAALGLAKVLGGSVSDLVIDTVENKGCCVVFCAHHAASDALKTQLVNRGLKVAILDGRCVDQRKRAALVCDFQEGQLDVLIGGINSAGEAITLTRADTVIFVELDWVPAALIQAEDRIHRVGQKRNCQVIQVVARMSGDNLDEMMVGLLAKKTALICEVLGEDVIHINKHKTHLEAVGLGNIETELHSHLLGKVVIDPQGQPLVETEMLVPSVREVTTAPRSVDAVLSETLDTEQEETQEEMASNVEKRRRGRPKVYLDMAPPTAAERSKLSIKALSDAGGKRVMLRLNPEAYEALKVIMAITGETQETAAINQALVARKNELLQVSTQT